MKEKVLGSGLFSSLNPNQLCGIYWRSYLYSTYNI